MIRVRSMAASILLAAASASAYAQADKCAMVPAAKEDCGKLSGDAKSKCEMHNRSMEAAGPCKGKAGAELEACVKGQAPAKPYN